MAQERTLSIIKPDGVARNLIGKIISMVEEQGLSIAASRMQFLSRYEAEEFYAVHRGKPFIDELVSYMCSGPVLLMVLEGENAIAKNRAIMGATNPRDAQSGTIRKLFGKSLSENTVHGSDGEETAVFEIGWFFSGRDLCARR
jgi:nucleoside-diphosphate kinase